MPSQHKKSKTRKNPRPPVDPRPSDQLLERLLLLDLEKDKLAWEIVGILQSRVPSIFPKLQELARGESLPAKVMSAAILGQNARSEKSLGKECVAEFTLLLEKESDPQVLCLAIAGLGGFENIAPRDLILSFAGHPDDDIRFHVACAIGTFEDEASIAAQIKLSQDADPETRSWATFGLGSLINEDTPAIREALAARLKDEDNEVRGEAVVGLANLLDPRVIAPLLQALKDSAPDHPGPHWEEAVQVIGDHADKLGPEWDRLLAALEDVDFPE